LAKLPPLPTLSYPPYPYPYILPPGILFPTISSLLPKTEGAAILSPSHLFSIMGDTTEEGPLGQNMRDLELFMGAISRNWDFRSRGVEVLISFVVCVNVNGMGCSGMGCSGMNGV